MFKSYLRAGEMASWVKMLATETDDLNLIPGSLWSLMTWEASTEKV